VLNGPVMPSNASVHNTLMIVAYLVAF